MENKTKRGLSTRLKSRFKSGVKSATRYALAGALGLSNFVFSINGAEADAYYWYAPLNFFNTFVRQNVTQSNFYGSGDVDNNNIVDFRDLEKLKNNQYINPDFADVNGDGVVNSNDVSLLESYLNKEITNLPSHLPSERNSQEDREYIINWINKMKKIDTTEKDLLSKYSQGWLCTDFDVEIKKNFLGIKNLPSRFKFETDVIHSNENNGRFNLPVYTARIWNSEIDFDHVVNAIMVGNNPTNFNDWYIFEPQTDNELKIGDRFFPKDSKVVINVYHEFKDNKILYDYLVAWNVVDGNPLFKNKNNNLILNPKPTSVKSQSPLEFKLNQNSPNPFNNATTISYSLEKPGNVQLDIYNSLGQRIETLVDNISQNAGDHSVNWNPLRDYSSGVYHYRLNVDGKNLSGKMVLSK